MAAPQGFKIDSQLATRNSQLAKLVYLIVTNYSVHPNLETLWKSTPHLV